MHTYRPDKFAHAYEKLNGQKYWSWLQQRHVVQIMEAACYLRRPAIEAISPMLKDAFPDVLFTLTLRQMIGHMVRQILEARGFHLKRANVRISQKDNVFRFGSAYVKAA